MSGYIVHKAVELKKVVKSRGLTLEQIETTYIAQPKYDGCNTVMVVDSRADKWFTFFSRTGEVVKSMDHVAAALALLPFDMPDGVYLGEAWAHDLKFPEISGRFRKQSGTEKTAQLQLVVFDYLTLDEWNAGGSQVTYEDRVKRIDPLLMALNAFAPLTVLKSFGILKDTWPNANAQDIANKLVAAGGFDGLILRDPLGLWVKGDNGTWGEIVKVKPRIRVSCTVVDFEHGKGKHAGKIGTLVVMHNGIRQGAGTGLKDSQRETLDFHYQWDGKIVEIEALGYTEDGFLREPVLLGVRTDVVEPDA